MYHLLLHQEGPADVQIQVVGCLGYTHRLLAGLPQDLADPITRVGTGGNNLRGLAAVYFFELPTFSSLATITNAQLQIEYLGVSPSSNTVTPEFNVDLFGIDARPDAIIHSGDYYDGDSAFSSDVLVQTAMIMPTTTGISCNDYIRTGKRVCCRLAGQRCPCRMARRE